ncbi:hypothetical protein HY383_02160 [Candidatus Daviesbacteria bacterium]|nr:hypothetical protein [Candidatus Daviesbacteria bacterium]
MALLPFTEEQKSKIKEEEDEDLRRQLRSFTSKTNQKHGVPAILSLFIPGLGQIVKGQTGKGILILICTLIGYFVFVVPGLIIHIWQIADAYNNNKISDNEDKPKSKVKWLGLILITLIILLLSLAGKYSSGTTSKESFQDLSRKRFDGILATSPELESIECLDGNCTSVVYFNFRKLPDDLEYMIRANTVTFSNFKYENTGTSNISIFATYNGSTLLQCDGGQGKVKDCKK